MDCNAVALLLFAAPKTKVLLGAGFTLCEPAGAPNIGVADGAACGGRTVLPNKGTEGVGIDVVAVLAVIG